MFKDDLSTVGKAGWAALSLPLLLALSILVVAGSALPTHAQLVPSPELGAIVPERTETPPDTLGRNTPRGLVSGFLSALAAGDPARASEYLDLSKIPVGERKDRGKNLAKSLEMLLDRGGWLNSPSQLAAENAGLITDNYGPDEDAVGGVLTPDGVVDIMGTRVTRGEAKPIWLISNVTLGKLPKLLAQSRPSLLDRYLWPSLKATTVWGVPIGHWVVLGLIFVLALGVGRVLTSGIGLLVRRLNIFDGKGQVFAISEAVLMPVGLILAVFLTRIAAFGLGMSVVARQYGGRIGSVILWFALAWLLWRGIDALARASRERATKKGHVGAISAVTLAGRAFKISLVGIAIFATLANFGFDVTTGLAALGIGGIALALGAQKTIENFVGSLTLVADHPVRIGDFCRFGDVFGEVEDIGMRSTRLRTLDRTVLSVPNGELATLQIENFTQRDRFWLHQELAVRLDTPHDRLRTLLKDLRSLLEIDNRLDPLANRVRLRRADRDALVVEVFAYIFAAGFEDYLEIQEELLFRIFETLTENGVDLALPTQTLLIDSGGNASLPEAADTPSAFAEEPSQARHLRSARQQ